MGWGFGTPGIRDNRDKEKCITEEKRAGIFAWDQETVLRKHCTTTTKRGAHGSKPQLRVRPAISCEKQQTNYAHVKENWEDLLYGEVKCDIFKEDKG